MCEFVCNSPRLQCMRVSLRFSQLTNFNVLLCHLVLCDSRRCRRRRIRQYEGICIRFTIPVLPAKSLLNLRLPQNSHTLTHTHRASQGHVTGNTTQSTPVSLIDQFRRPRPSRARSLCKLFCVRSCYSRPVNNNSCHKKPFQCHKAMLSSHYAK